MDTNGIRTSGDARPLQVAIVGGGLIGVITALSLSRRGMNVAMYERASTWHEISAGISFTGAARECMQQLHPSLVDILSEISQKTDSSTSNSYWDAYHPRTREDAEDEAKSLLFRTPATKVDFWGCVRSEFLLRMGKLLPDGLVKFGKQLDNYEDDEENEKVVLHFKDGSSAEADVLLGCDGVHSTTRKVMFGASHPAANAGYSHNFAYRVMVPIEMGIAALGQKSAVSACMHCGPETWVLTYPVMSGKMLNVAIFAYNAEDFPDPVRMTAPGSRAEIKEMFKGWCPQFEELWKLFPENPVKWGLFDMTDNPPPTYAQGRACLVGDSAHASTPYLGVGACTGIEDALVISELLSSVERKVAYGEPRPEVLKEALQTYSRARLDRGRWVHCSSREVGSSYQWRYSPAGRDPARIKKKVVQDCHTVVSYDVLAQLRADPRWAE